MCLLYESINPQHQHILSRKSKNKYIPVKKLKNNNDKENIVKAIREKGKVQQLTRNNCKLQK